MMLLVEAERKHVDQITDLLAANYAKYNEKYQVPIYKTSPDIFAKHIIQRIEEPSSYKYRVLENDENEFVGFVNYEIKNDICYVLTLLLKEEYNTKMNIKLLYDSVLADAKSNKVTSLLVQTFAFEDEFKQFLKENNAQIASYEVIVNNI